MKIGFTGARNGMTDAQKEAVRAFLVDNGCTELHHGDCIGADADAHNIAVSLGIRTVIHPPEKDDLRAFCEGDEIREAKGYLARDRDIVTETDQQIGTPSGETETPRSGTWYTLRYAIKMLHETTAFAPDGRVMLTDELKEKTPGNW